MRDSSTDSKTPQDSPSDEDFYRGGNATLHRESTGAGSDNMRSAVISAVGSVPSISFGIVLLGGLVLAALVAWSTISSTAYGYGVSVLAIAIIVLATAASFSLGVIVGRDALPEYTP